MSDTSNYRDYAQDGKIGIDLTATYPSISAGSVSIYPHKPGDRISGSNNSVYIFARAASDITQFQCVVFGVLTDSSLSSDATRAPLLQCAPANTTNAIKGGVMGDGMIGISQVSIASSYYGWIAINGSALRVNVIAATKPKVPLFLSGTSGSLDDATVSSAYVSGITLNTSAPSASAAWCIANWPKILHVQTSTT